MALLAYAGTGPGLPVANLSSITSSQLVACAAVSSGRPSVRAIP
jgi:hypothetical protein